MAQKETAKDAQKETVEERSTLESLLDIVDVEAPKTVSEGTAAGQLSQAINLLIHSVATPERQVDRVDKVLVDSVIAEIDQKISAQVNEVLHNESFQKLESSWRGLKHLVDNTNFRRNIKLEILNVSKEDLRNDFEEVPETFQSGLMAQMYKDEYDVFGGEPVGAIIGNYAFENNIQDMGLLQNLSKVASACHAPFIGSVGSSFLGQSSMEEMVNVPDVDALFEKSEYAAWRSFRESEDSRYVGLTLPRFLLRTPYGADSIPAKTFNFEEQVEGKDHEKYLWGNASVAFASTLTRSFAENGWCVNIRGPKAGGLVEDLPLHFFESSGETTAKIPTEVAISDVREFELAKQGFIPLVFKKNENYACFFSANSTQSPKEYVGDADATANARLSSRLPYLFLVSRLAHYLKAMQRDNIGTDATKEQLEQKLNKWIGTLVTEMQNPDPKLKARCPLSAAEIHVTDFADNPGFYSVEMMVRPHFQVEGVDVDLSLVSRLPKKKG